MKEKLNINFDKYDDKHFIIFIKRGSNNLFLDFGLCNFEEEMEYWDMPTKLIDFKGEEGFIFDSYIDKRELEEEIQRFVKRNNI